MSTNRFSNYSEKDLLAIVNGLSDNSIKFTIPELKELQSELINKRIDPQKIGVISNVIMNQISQNENKSEVRERRNRRAETKKMKVVKDPAKEENEKTMTVDVPIAPELKTKEKQPEAPLAPAEIEDRKAKSKKEKKVKEPAPVYEEEFEEDEENFPVLNFLVVFYRVVGWLCVLLLIGGFAVTGYLMLMDNLPMLICGGGLTLFAAGLLLLFFSAKAEGILLKLQIERHLRNLDINNY